MSGPEYDEVVIEISEIVRRSVIQSSTEYRIYKVPHTIRKWNSEAYTPQVIAVGPFHHENQRLKGMEEVKEIYFGCFVRRSNLDVGYLVGIVWELEGRIRGCYDETIGFSSDRFVKMILLDAGFILELFLRHIWSSLNGPVAVELRDDAIMYDLILLENQLPFFVIEELFNLASPFLPNGAGLLELCFCYFDQFNICRIEPHPDVNIEHFTDLLRTFRIPPLAERPGRDYGMVSCVNTPTYLLDAGVKIECGARGSRLCMDFEAGVLKIPTTVLDDGEEVIARNIIALEQTRYIGDGYFTDYFIFMGLFIRTREDVDLLSDKGIFTKFPSDGNAAVSLIENLTKGILRINVSNEYRDLCRRLNTFYVEPWLRRKAQIRRDYYRNRSAIISAIFAGGVATVLTLIQTVCSIMQVTGSGKG